MNPQTKVFYNGKQLKRTTQGRFTSFKSKLETLWKYTKITTAILTINAAIVLILATALSTSTVTASTTTIVQTVPPSPVLERIADCESGNGTPNSASQYAKSGQVLMKANTNGTVDVGKYQINSVWFAKATALNLDITTLAGNKAMAEWIYANKGTGDWSSSSHCWNH